MGLKEERIAKIKDLLQSIIGADGIKECLDQPIQMEIPLEDMTIIITTLKMCADALKSGKDRPKSGKRMEEQAVELMRIHEVFSRKLADTARERGRRLRERKPELRDTVDTWAALDVVEEINEVSAESERAMKRQLEEEKEADGE